MSLIPHTGKQVVGNLDRDRANLVSVVIPYYNNARFLSESIESVLAQTYSNFEIVVVDDGSTDDPEQIASQCPDVRFIRQHNQGVAAARNRGLNESIGKFVIFLDADDRLLPEALEAGLDCFRKNPNCGFVFGYGQLMDATGNCISEMFAGYEGGGYEEILLRNPIGFPALVMYDRKAVESVGGYRSFVQGKFMANSSDYDLNLQLSSRYPISCHGKTVAQYRYHAGNTSGDHSMMAESLHAVLQSQFEFVNGNKKLESALKQALENWRRNSHGEMRVTRARANARQRDWRRVAEDLVWLSWFEPGLAIENAKRKLQHELFKRRATKKTSASE